MCLAIPAKVVQKLDDDRAVVEVGDYVIVHVGFAITRLDVEEAEKSLALFEDMTFRLESITNEVHK